MIATLVKLITILLIILVLVIILTSSFIGLGYFIIQLFPLSLFEATLLCMGAAAMLMIGFIRVNNDTYFMDDDDLEDDDD
jgi:hypothetical protein